MIETIEDYLASGDLNTAMIGYELLKDFDIPDKDKDVIMGKYFTTMTHFMKDGSQWASLRHDVWIGPKFRKHAR